MLGNVLLNRLNFVVDGRCTQLFDQCHLFFTASGGIHIGTEVFCQLQDQVAGATESGQAKHLPILYPG